MEQLQHSLGLFRDGRWRRARPLHRTVRLPCTIIPSMAAQDQGRPVEPISVFPGPYCNPLLLLLIAHEHVGMW